MTNSKHKSSKRKSSKHKSSKHSSKTKIKRKSSKVKRKSNSKMTWETFLKNKDSRKALTRSWSSKNPQKYYKSTIVKLAKKYSNKK